MSANEDNANYKKWLREFEIAIANQDLEKLKKLISEDNRMLELNKKGDGMKLLFKALPAGYGFPVSRIGATNPEIVELLIDHFENINIEQSEANTKKNTLLMIAASNGWEKVVDKLLNKKVDINLKNKRQESALWFALNSRSPEKNINIIAKIVQRYIEVNGEASLAAANLDKKIIMNLAVICLNDQKDERNEILKKLITSLDKSINDVDLNGKPYIWEFLYHSPINLSFIEQQKKIYLRQLKMAIFKLFNCCIRKIS